MLHPQKVQKSNKQYFMNHFSEPSTEACLDPTSILHKKHSQMLQQRYFARFLLSLHSGLYKSDHFLKLIN